MVGGDGLLEKVNSRRWSTAAMKKRLSELVSGHLGCSALLWETCNDVTSLIRAKVRGFF